MTNEPLTDSGRSRCHTGRWLPFLAPALIAIGACIAYANTFRVPFLFDDSIAVVQNPSIADLGQIGKVLSPGTVIAAWRPLLNLSFAINNAWSGQRVWSYHLVNLAVHILAGLTLFGVVRRSLIRWSALSPTRSNEGRKQRVGDNALHLALAIALLWTLHPLQSESVTYICQRAESLMGLFYLLTLYCFIRGTGTEAAQIEKRKAESGNVEAGSSAEKVPLSAFRFSLWPVWFTLSFIACIMGMATKEPMVTAPFLILLYDRAFFSGSFREAVSRRWRYYLGLSSSWFLLWYLMEHGNLQGARVGLHAGVSWLTYALTELKVVAGYLKLSLWPHPLIFDYGREVLVTSASQAALAAILLAPLAIATLIAWRWSKALGFVAASFFILLSPTSSFVPVATQPMAESRMYLPLAAVVTLIVLAGYAWVGRRAFAGLFIASIALAALTIQRNRDYRSSLTIWTDTVAKQPGSARGQLYLALELSKIPGRLSEALEHNEQALRINPKYAAAHNNLANDLAKIPGRLPEALKHYEEALRIDPKFAMAHVNFAVALARVPGRSPEVLEHYERALQIDPDLAGAHAGLANELVKVPGRLPEALEHYEQALRIQPNFAAAHNNLANHLAKIPGRLPEALEHYEQALRIEPNFAMAHVNFAIALAGIPGRLPEALEHYEEALRIDPRSVGAHVGLANELAKIPGRLPEALEHYEEALRIDPGDREVRNNFGKALFREGRNFEAIEQYRKALAIGPGSDQAEVHCNLGLALEKGGRREEAIAQFQEALRLRPGYAEARRDLERLKMAP